MSESFMFVGWSSVLLISSMACDKVYCCEGLEITIGLDGIDEDIDTFTHKMEIELEPG